MKRALAAAFVVVVTTVGVAFAPAAAVGVVPFAAKAQPAPAGSGPPASRAEGASAVQRLIAPPSACPAGGTAAGAQLRQMLCLTNFARRAEWLPRLAPSAGLRRAAAHKDADILSCDEFSHEACGRGFSYWVGRFTNCRAIAENIAWGTGRLGSARGIFSAWMHSPGHRENILGPYEAIGIAARFGGVEGNSGAHVWTQDFGADC